MDRISVFLQDVAKEAGVSSQTVSRVAKPFVREHDGKSRLQWNVSDIAQIMLHAH